MGIDEWRGTSRQSSYTVSIGKEWDQYRRQIVYTVGIDEERDQYRRQTDRLHCGHWRGEGLVQEIDRLFTL